MHPTPPLTLCACARRSTDDDRLGGDVGTLTQATECLKDIQRLLRAQHKRVKVR